MSVGTAAFFCGNPIGSACFEALKNEMLLRYPDTEIKVQKTQISFYDSGLFLCVSLPRRRAERGIVVTFGLDAPVPDVRIAQTVEPCPGRWTHHVPVSSPEEVDGQLLAWIDWAHSFKMRTKRSRSRKDQP